MDVLWLEVEGLDNQTSEIQIEPKKGLNNIYNIIVYNLQHTQKYNFNTPLFSNFS